VGYLKLPSRTIILTGAVFLALAGTITSDHQYLNNQAGVQLPIQLRARVVARY
jgi:hypothetical protein